AGKGRPSGKLTRNRGRPEPGGLPDSTERPQAAERTRGGVAKRSGGDQSGFDEERRWQAIHRGMNCAANCAAKGCRGRTSRACWPNWMIITKIYSRKGVPLWERQGSCNLNQVN